MRTLGTLVILSVLGLACSSKTGSGTNQPASGGRSSQASGGVGGSAPGTGGASVVGAGGATAGQAGAPPAGGATPVGGEAAVGGTSPSGGAKGAGGAGSVADAAVTEGSPGDATDGGRAKLDGAQGGASASGGATATGGASGTGGTTTGCTASGPGPVGTITGDLATGVVFKDTDGKPVNAHGGGIIRVCDTFYMHGEYFLSTTTDNNFNGFSMYSSRDLATWKNEGIILPQQASGELGPNRKGERPHIIKCPSSGEFVLYAHAADVTYQADKEIVYATSATVNGQYSYQGPLKNASGSIAAHSDMSAYADETGAYVLTESGHVYTLASDCHSWLSDKSFSAINGDSGGAESPTVFKAKGTYYWIGSYKTGWRANNNFYATAPAMTGPWTYQGFVAPVSDTSTTVPAGAPNPPEEISDQRTWLSQSTWVQPVVGSTGTVYVYWGDHWYGNQDTTNPGKHNDQATYVFQPIVFDTSTKMLLPTYLPSWKIDVGAGTWSQ